MAKLTLDKSQYDKGLDSAEASANSFSSKLGRGLKAVGSGALSVVSTTAKIAAGATAAAGIAIGKLTKDSVEAYAEQEQLIGGIQTLFGDSATEVINKANRAFKTAGFSMNDYMETAIQSAASLISSLEGDQAQAAKLMDMTIIDMSDNVNKMGTTMEAVQNAYRGFSRGNFTMLDNLALGFAGTKEGMQELLNKAKELTGIDYNIDNYADIVQAIHAINENMGIAGTTSKEAAGTISGSLATLKTSWQNFVAGLASPDADLGQLFTDMFESAGGVIKNTIPTIDRVLKAFADNIETWIEKIASSLSNVSVDDVGDAVDVIEDIINNTLRALAKSGPQLLEVGEKIIYGLFEGLDIDWDSLSMIIEDIVESLILIINDNAYTLADMGIQLFLAIINGFANALPESIPLIVNTLLGLVDLIIDNIDAFVDAGINLLIGLIDGFVIALPQIATVLPIIILKIVQELTKPEMIEKLSKAAVTIITALADGLITFISVLLDVAPDIIKRLASALTENLPHIKAAAWAIMMTLVNHFLEKLPDLRNAGDRAMVMLWDLLKSFVRKFFDVGDELVGGIVSGIKNKWTYLTNTVKSLANAALSAAKKALGIHSPSTVFEQQVGAMMAEGIGRGFSLEMPDTIKDIQNQLDFVDGLKVPDVNVSRETYAGTGEIVLSIDGHELARFLAPAMNSQLAFGRA